MGVIPLRQHLDESVRVGEFCCLVYFFIRCVQLAVADVLLDRSGEEVRILKHNAQGVTQIRLLDLVDVDVVVPDLAVGHIVEPVDQVGDGGLAGAGGSDEGDLLTRLRIQRQVMEHHVVRRVSEGHVVEAHVAFQLLIGDGAVRLMRMLPRPQAGALFALGDISVRVLLRVDQFDIAVVYLRLFIHHVEDTLRTCQRHDDGVELLRHLHERLGKALCELQVGRHNAQRDISDARHGEESSEHRGEHELQVAQVADDGAHHAGKCMGVGRAVEEPFVKLVKLALRDLLVVEYFDDPLAVHPLFHESGDVRQIHLLADEIFPAVAGHDSRHEGHDADHQYGHHRQDRAQHQHGDKCHDDRERRHKHLRDGLVDHLSQGVGIICIKTHDRAVCILIEIPDRQRLHVGEHLVADTLEDALSDHNHHPAVYKGRNDAAQEDDPEDRKRHVQLRVIRVLLPDQRDDKVIQQELERQGHRDRRHGTHQDTDQHDDELDLIGTEHIVQQALRRLDRSLGDRRAAAGSLLYRLSITVRCLTHCPRPLSPVIHILPCKCHSSSEVLRMYRCR